MAQIDKQIWIGSFEESTNPRFLKERNITHILCCAKEFPYTPGFLIVEKRTNCWQSITNLNSEADFKEIASQLDIWIRNGNTVIVHCSADYSRSIAVITAYYILYKNLSYDVAFSHVKYRSLHSNISELYSNILKNL